MSASPTRSMLDRYQAAVLDGRTPTEAWTDLPTCGAPASRRFAATIAAALTRRALTTEPQP